MRYATEKLGEDHPIVQASHVLLASEGLGGSLVVDHRVIDTWASHPLNRTVCYATRSHAETLARKLNDGENR